MIRRKFLATLTAASVMASMYAVSTFATTATTEWNNEGGSSTVTGTSEYIGPEFVVELPETLYFGINPFELDLDQDTTTPDNKQILSTDYLMINYSNIPVKIDTQTKASEVKGNIVLAEQYEGHAANKVLTPSNTSGKVNTLLLQKFPVNVSVVNDEIKLDYQNVVLTGNSTVTADDYAADYGAQVITASAIGTISFRLEEYKNETLSAGNVSGFTFDGAVDATTPLTADDTVTVQTVFTLHSMGKAEYATGYAANGVYSGAHASVLGDKQ